ncbi:MAG: hypothetical protein ACP5QA_00565 [Phycisphaerae bacterium]
MENSVMGNLCRHLASRNYFGGMFSAILAVGFFLGKPSMAQAASIALPSVTIHINASTGDYLFTSASPAWTFRGTVAAAMRNIQRSSGRDNLGAFKEIKFTWGPTSDPRTGILKCYMHSGMLLAGITGGSPRTVFPDFTSIPPNLRVLSFKNAVFAGPEFHAQADSMPWVLFNRHADTAIISPASAFLISRLAGNAKTSIGAELNPNVSDSAAARMRWTILMMGRGIQRTLNSWGHALDRLYNRPRIGNEGNVVLRNFGYWTDNGACYYYNYVPKLGYAGTLEAVARQFDRHKVPLAYMELDSWWYRKSDRFVDGTILKAKAGKFPPGRWNIYGGIWQYRASHQLFPQGLGAFQKKLGVPLVCHGRWIDPHSPYHKKYTISGIAPIDPAWWKSTANYFAQSGVIGYEQDWLNYIYQYSPAMQVSRRVGNAFTGNMAASLAQHNVSLIYCMPLPRFFLQSARTPTLSMIRCSDDYFIQQRWLHFVYTSSLAYAMDLWPWTDTLMSRDTGSILLATLSAGPVGVGDQMGHESWRNIRKVIRSDGRIVKPDAPLRPTDQTIMAQAVGKHRPFVARTYSNSGIKTTYLFIWRQKGGRPSVHIAPAELGLSARGRYDVYNYFTHAVSHLSAGQSLEVNLHSNQWQYDIVAPEQTNGVAIFGDLKQFVPMGRERIADAAVTTTGIKLTVMVAKGEQAITVTGYSKHGISATVHDGSISTSADGRTGLFTVTVSPGTGTPEVKDFHKTVQDMTVKLSNR